MGIAAEIRRIAKRVMSPSIRRDLEVVADSIGAQDGSTGDELARLAGIRNAIGANADAQAHFERASASFVVRLLDTGEALPGTTVRFGTGGLIINTGTYGDEPAVFVDRAPYRGVPGEKAPDIPAGTPAMLRLLFPTREQAKAVCDALVIGGQTPSEDEMLAWATGWRSEDGEPEELTTEQRMVWCIVRAIRREMTTNRLAARSQP
jgi:hypothetical protein